MLKNISCLYFSPIAKLWPWKNVIFKVFVFWRYSKTLSLPEFSSMYIPIIKQLSCTADFRNISDNFSNLSVIDTLHDVISICQEANLHKTPSSNSFTLQRRHLLNSFTQQNILDFVTCSPVIESTIALEQLITFGKNN